MQDLIEEEVHNRWTREMEYRCNRLEQVFDEFDVSQGKSLSVEVLMRLGGASPKTQVLY